jgi:hypothetical protein
MVSHVQGVIEGRFLDDEGDVIFINFILYFDVGIWSRGDFARLHRQWFYDRVTAIARVSGPMDRDTIWTLRGTTIVRIGWDAKVRSYVNLEAAELPANIKSPVSIFPIDNRIIVSCADGGLSSLFDGRWFGHRTTAHVAEAILAGDILYRIENMCEVVGYSVDALRTECRCRSAGVRWMYAVGGGIIVMDGDGLWCRSGSRPAGRDVQRLVWEGNEDPSLLISACGPSLTGFLALSVEGTLLRLSGMVVKGWWSGCTRGHVDFSPVEGESFYRQAQGRWCCSTGMLM